MAQPNILFVMFDQMAALSLPGYGHPLVKTPNLNRLAAAGTLFENAYCNSPLCSPARFALLTGCRPSRIGAYDNATELPSGIPTLPHYLRAAGYRTCLSGKMDFTGADQLHGYEERLTTDLAPSDFGWVPDWTRPDAVQPWYHTLQSVAEAGPCDYTLAMQYDEDAFFRAGQWLHQAAGDADPRPFMLTVSIMHPHDPYQGPRRFWDLYDPAAIDLPRVEPLPPAARDKVGQRMYRLYDRGEIPVGAREIRNARHAYYAMITYADDLLGQLLRKLELLGLAENTLVVATSDHGDMLGERGLWYKMNFFERAVRVPLILAGPGIAAGRRIAQPVSHLDLLPTLGELAAGSTFAPTGRLDGASLAPALRHGEAPVGEVVGEYMGEGYDHPVVMLRRDHWKLVYSRHDGAALYDLAADPLELRNLADDIAYEEQLRGLIAEIERRWDLDRIHAEVLESQGRRRLIHRALTRGKLAPWDYEPRSDAAGLYYRNYSSDPPDPDRALRLPRRRD